MEIQRSYIERTGVVSPVSIHSEGPGQSPLAELAILGEQQATPGVSLQISSMCPPRSSPDGPPGVPPGNPSRYLPPGVPLCVLRCPSGVHHPGDSSPGSTWPGAFGSQNLHSEVHSRGLRALAETLLSVSPRTGRTRQAPDQDPVCGREWPL